MKDFADRLHDFKLRKWDMLNPRVIWLDENSAILWYVWTGTARQRRPQAVTDER